MSEAGSLHAPPMVSGPADKVVMTASAEILRPGKTSRAAG
jgi:hypothetical protein